MSDAPAMDFTPAFDPHVQDLIAENARQKERIETLQRRLLMREEVLLRIDEIVHGAVQVKGVHG